MSTLSHITANPTTETPSVSETAVGGQAGASIVPKDTATISEQQNPNDTSEKPNPSNALESNQPGSAEAAAEKFFQMREKAQQESKN
jgi:hypothetical protein